MTTSGLMTGTLAHRRRGEVAHEFKHGIFHVLLDIDEVAALDRGLRLFGYRSPSLYQFDDRDHFGTVDLPVRTKLSHWLANNGHDLAGRRVLLLTNLRVLGYVFNPVSWWFVMASDGKVDLIVAEVNNTFGESYSYLLDDLEEVGASLRSRRPKAFHVSPFQPVTGDYSFAISPPGPTMTVHMRVDRDGKRAFDATLRESRRPLTDASLLFATFRYPLMTLRTVWLIHWQALRLAVKRAKFFRKPSPPANDYLDTPADREVPGSELLETTIH